MILHQLLGKHPLSKKTKPQKSPIPQHKKSNDTPGTGAALDRVRSQLRRNALKAREPTTKMSLTNDKKHVSTEDKKIMDKIKQIEEFHGQHDSKKRNYDF
jgi:hypothetical protein